MSANVNKSYADCITELKAKMQKPKNDVTTAAAIPMTSFVSPKLFATEKIVVQEPAAAECVDWQHVPTKAEYLQLSKLSLFGLIPEEIETRAECCLSTTSVLIQHPKWKTKVEQLKVQTQQELKELPEPYKYVFPAASYKGQLDRLQEDVIREVISDAQRQTFEVVQPRMWELLAARLSDDSWKYLWETIDLKLVFRFNWILHLQKQKEESVRLAQEKAYNDAGIISRWIGWY